MIVVAASRLVSSASFVFLVGPRLNHVLQLGDSSRACATEVDVGALVKDTFLEGINDFPIGDIHNVGALVEESMHAIAEGLALLLLDLGEIHPIAVAT